MGVSAFAISAACWLRPRSLDHELRSKAWLVVVVRGALRADAGGRAVGVHGPGIARGGRDHVEHLLPVETQFVSQRECLAGCDHRRPQDHVVADFGGLSCAPPRRSGRPFGPMISKSGSALAKASALPPAMKVSVPAAAPPMPPETGASTKSRPASVAASAALRALSTSTVEQSIKSAPWLICWMASAAT